MNSVAPGLVKTSGSRALVRSIAKAWVAFSLIPVSLLAPLSANARHQISDIAVPPPVVAPGTDTWHAPPIPDGLGLPPLNVRVVNFAVQSLGTQIGNGECWTLAEQALLNAGAHRAIGYVFGRQLSPSEPWLPGDIVQFTTCHFEYVQPNRRTTFDLGSPNHTAIVHSVPYGLVVILQQNVNHDRRAQTQTLDFSKMVSGSVKVYRPVPASDGSFFQGGPAVPTNETKVRRHKKHKGDDDSSE